MPPSAEPAELRLRALEAGDAEAVFDMMREPEAVALAAFTAADPDDRAAFDAWFARVLADPSARTFAIEAGGGFAGTVAAFDIEGERELSYWVRRALWGRGVAGRALALLLELETAQPLHARAASANAASRRVLERAGFRAVGTDTGFAPGLGRDVEETIYRLD